MNKAYLTCEVAGLPAGTEMMTIDDTPINHIREKLFLYIRSDGNILTKKYWDVNFGDSPFPFLTDTCYNALDEIIYSSTILNIILIK